MQLSDTMHCGFSRQSDGTNLFDAAPRLRPMENG